MKGMGIRSTSVCSRKCLSPAATCATDKQVPATCSSRVPVLRCSDEYGAQGWDGGKRWGVLVCLSPVKQHD